MRPLHEIHLRQLQQGYKYLRHSRYFPKELEHYNPVGLTKAELVELFAYIVEHVPKEINDSLPEHVQQFYNYIFMDEAELRSGYMSEFKKVKKCDQFGRTEGSQAYLIDEMLIEGGYTSPEMSRAAGCNEGRIRSHLNALRKQFAEKYIIVTQKRGRLSRYYVKEKKHEQKINRTTVVKSFI